MRALVIYESMFGNTKLVAEAIADGLSRHGQVDLLEVSQAHHQLPQDLDLLVIGGPTHAFGLSRPKTRESAAQQAPAGLVSSGIGIREWLAKLAGVGRKIPTTSFDTKLGKPSWLPGSAARGAANRLKRLGLPIAATPQSFYVAATLGPLADGELIRARQWGEDLARMGRQPSGNASSVPKP